MANTTSIECIFRSANPFRRSVTVQAALRKRGMAAGRSAPDAAKYGTILKPEFDTYASWIGEDVQPWVVPDFRQRAFGEPASVVEHAEVVTPSSPRCRAR
jgi:hypothetical protein